MNGVVGMGRRDVGTVHRLLAGAVIAVLVAACGTGDPGSVPGEASVLRAAGVEREAPPADAPVDATVQGMTAFGYDFYRVSAEPASNTVVSPLSIATAFAMARVGAGGQTADQIDAVLRYPPDGVHAAFNAITRELVTESGPPPRTSPAAARTPGESAPPVLSMTNGLFVQEGKRLQDEFLRILASQYGAGAQAVDFTSPEAIEIIDAWVREQTADRIKKLFDELGPETRVVLANAVYFKADWALPFAEYPTTTESFTRADGSTVRAPMMHLQGDLRYATGDTWQAVELPYADSSLAMWVLVPTGQTTPGELLAPETFTDVATRLTPGQVDLSMPRWDFATDLDLIPPLEELGMEVPFHPGADFSGMLPGVWIDQAVHRANITVDEWGTEAAAVTGLGFDESGPPPPDVTIRADHPFAFAIVDTNTRTPLFIGHVADPTATD
jgi:serine protease inhibitor